MGRNRRPRLAVWKFASCDGCQLTLLDCEDELLTIAGRVDVAYFPEASRAQAKGPYDLSLVEGSISTASDLERIRQVRRASKRLVTIGACATAGGIQALRNFADVKEFVSIVYARPDYIATLASSTAIADHVPVDFELRGCPINKRQLLAGKHTHMSTVSRCLEQLIKTQKIETAITDDILGPIEATLDLLHQLQAVTGQENVIRKVFIEVLDLFLHALLCF